nr:zf-BED domain-containing protein [Tanacetum cinerariifolium]
MHRIARVHEESSSFNVKEWEDIQDTIEANEELALRIQAEEREKYSKAEKARLLVDLINQRKRHFAQQSAKERRNKPLTQAQQRTNMSNYVKHMGSHTLQQLKRLSFDELKSLFEVTIKRVKTFTPMESDVDRTIPKIADESSKRAAKESLEQQIKERFSTTEPTDDKEKELCVKLKRLFKPDNDDTLWKLQSNDKEIKEEFEKLGLLEINKDLFTYDTQLGTIFNDFNRLIRFNDNLFTYEIEIPKPTRCVKQQTDDPTHNDLKEYKWKMCYEECKKIYAQVVIFINNRLIRLINVTVKQWLDLKYGDHKKMDKNAKKGVIGTW